MHADMTAVTIQSHKILLNEVKDNKAPLVPLYGNKLNELWPPIAVGFRVWLLGAAGTVRGKWLGLRHAWVLKACVCSF